MNRDFVYNGLLKRGQDPRIAAAAAMNFEDESSFNPAAIGDGGLSIGMGQWHKDRADRLKQFSGGTWQDPEKQLDFYVHELNTTETRARDEMLKARNDGEAAAAMVKYYERPAKEHLEKRTAKYLGQSYQPSQGQDPGVMSFLPGGTPPDQSSYGVFSSMPPEAPPEEPTKFQQWAAEKAPWLSGMASPDSLLAIGTGLLAGDDWASGIGAAGQNVLALRQQDEKEKQGRQESWQKHQWDMQRDAQKAQQQTSQGGKLYASSIQVSGINQESGKEEVRAGVFENGEYFVYDDKGQKVPAASIYGSQFKKANNSDSGSTWAQAGGIPNAASVDSNGVPQFKFERESEGKAYSYTLRAIQANKNIDRLTESLGQEKLASVSTRLGRWAATNADSRVTAGVLNSILEDEGISGTLASTYSRYLQAILRNDTGAAYTGTEIADYAQTYLPVVGEDPETTRAKAAYRQQEIAGMIPRAGAGAAYLSGLQAGEYPLPYDYDPTNPEGPAQDLQPGEVRTTILPPEEAASPAPVVTDDAPPPTFEGDPEDWKYLTPEQKALWRQQEGALDQSNAGPGVLSNLPIGGTLSSIYSK